VIETLELEECVVELYDPPKLLVEWSSPWHEFVTSVRPALVHSQRRLAGEAPFGLIPLRVMIPSYVLEAFLIFVAIFVQVKIAELQPFVAPRFSSHDVIYYSGDELPRTEDLGGSQAGTTGRAGGGEAHHRAQTIRIARGGSLVPKVVDAPNLKLPSSRDAVANLLAIQANPGPPPADGLRSTRTAPSLATALVAPAPNVIRDYTRNGVQLQSVIAPAPSVSRDQPLTGPSFSATLIPPAPNVARDHTLVAPALGPAVIPPAPGVARERALVAPSLSASVVAPTPSVARDQTRSAPSLAANVIPAAPGAVSREFSRSPVQMNAAVVPPPVSAPERAAIRSPKLNLPAPSVIAPPPLADISQDVHRLASASMPDSSMTVVPPPPTQTSSGTFMSSLMGKIFGATEVVPPPPSVHSNSSSTGTGSLLAANVVPPPPAVGTNPAGGNPRGTRNGMGAALGPNVVAPPPSTGMSNVTGTRSLSSSSSSTLGTPSVIAPPPSLSGAGGGTGNTGGGAGTPRGTLVANNIVPPPPSVGAGTGSTGSGLSRSGAGLGAPLDAGTGLAPPTTGGSRGNAGAVISSQPGPKVGLPSSGGAGSLAMSPTGGDKPGLGGAGAGSSIGHGNGRGSGMSGAGPGAGKAAAAHGSDADARGGISPTAGPGGAGNAPSGTPPVRGVDISGGSGIVTIPGFGSNSSTSDLQTPGHSTVKQRQTLGVTVVATATSGGAFEPYKKLLRGEKYTTYFDTSLGTVVMEFADEAATGHPYGGTLTGPTAMRTDLASGLPHARMVVSCALDASGNVKNVRVLEAGPAEMTAKVLSGLRSWKFQPAMRGNQPVEVTAILGFGIDTNDRF
jgi:TonB family protein